MPTQQQKNSTNYLVPFIIMVVLMSLVGLITSLNQQFQAPMKAAYLIQTGQSANTWTTFLNFAFFSAYLLMGQFSARYIDRNGYKKGLLKGLSVLILGFTLYVVSAWVFETLDKPKFEATIEVARQLGKAFTYTGPIILPLAYWLFVIAAFVSGTALTYIQAVINPYLIACEVKGTTGVQRQNIAGTGNSIVTTFIPLFVAYIIFQQKEGVEVEIASLYGPMLGLLLLVVLLILAVRNVRLPEIESVSTKGEHLPHNIWKVRHLRWGFIALFCLIGMEVCLGSNIILYAMEDLSYSYDIAVRMAFFYWAGMLLGRFLSSFISTPARTQLTIGAIGASLLLLIALLTKNPWFLCGTGLCHSVMWSAIFALALDGLGKYTAKGSGVVIMGLFGGAVLPLIQGALSSYMGEWGMSWLIVLACELTILYYALVTSKVRENEIQSLNKSLS